MTYEEAVRHVTSRRPVLPHVGLRDALYRLYPRPWGPRLEARSSSTVYSEDLEPEPEEPEQTVAEPESVPVQESKTEASVGLPQSTAEVVEEKAAEPETVPAPEPQAEEPEVVEQAVDVTENDGTSGVAAAPEDVQPPTEVAAEETVPEPREEEPETTEAACPLAAEEGARD